MYTFHHDKIRLGGPADCHEKETAWKNTFQTVSFLHHCMVPVMEMLFQVPWFCYKKIRLPLQLIQHEDLTGEKKPLWAASWSKVFPAPIFFSWKGPVSFLLQKWLKKQQHQDLARWQYQSAWQVAQYYRTVLLQSAGLC